VDEKAKVNADCYTYVTNLIPKRVENQGVF